MKLVTSPIGKFQYKVEDLSQMFLFHDLDMDEPRGSINISSIHVESIRVAMILAWYGTSESAGRPSLVRSGWGWGGGHQR